VWVVYFPDESVSDDAEKLQSRIRTLKQYDNETKSFVQNNQNTHIDITFAIAFTSNFRIEIEKAFKFVEKYLDEHNGSSIEIIAILKNQYISNRSFIKFTTDIITKLSVVQFDSTASNAEYFAAAALGSHGDLVFLFDFGEFDDLNIFNTYRSVLRLNKKQVIIGSRSGVSSIFSRLDREVFRIFKTNDDFLVTRLMTKEAAFRVFANIHVTDEFFTVDANRLARLMHMKVKIVTLFHFKKPVEYSPTFAKKFTRVLSIGVFYKINIWTYKRMKEYFKNKTLPLKS
jgi:ribosome-associated translation inhibitor RaiA